MDNRFGNICTCTRCNGIVHTIRRGDTLYLLSRHYNVSVNDIMNANRNVNIYNLRIGDEICIPVRRVIEPRDNMEFAEEIREEFNDMNDNMSTASIEEAAKDNNFIEKEQIKLKDILDMDMSISDFISKLKEFDK